MLRPVYYQPHSYPLSPRSAVLSAMQLFAVVSTALALLIAPVLGAPSAQLKTVEKFAGQTKPNSYIIKLKSGASKDSAIASLQAEHGESTRITHSEWQGDVLHGFAGAYKASRPCGPRTSEQALICTSYRYIRKGRSQRAPRQPRRRVHRRGRYRQHLRDSVRYRRIIVYLAAGLNLLDFSHF